MLTINHWPRSVKRFQLYFNLWLRTFSSLGILEHKNPYSDSEILPVLCSRYLYSLAEAIVEAWSWKIAWYFYAYISAGSNGNFGGKTGKISDCWVNKVRTICTKPKHCKNSLGISDQRSKCRNTLRGFQWSLLWILNVLIIRKFMTAGWLIVFFEQPCPWVEDFITCWS